MKELFPFFHPFVLPPSLPPSFLSPPSYLTILSLPPSPSSLICVLLSFFMSSLLLFLLSSPLPPSLLSPSIHVSSLLLLPFILSSYTFLPSLSLDILKKVYMFLVQAIFSRDFSLQLNTYRGFPQSFQEIPGILAAVAV